MKKLVIATNLCWLLVLASSPASSCVAAFGYTGTNKDNIDTIASNVDVGTAFIAPASPTASIVNDAEYLVAKSGPVFINLQTIIFKQGPDSVACNDYERGGLTSTEQYSKIAGSYQSNIDMFFATNAALFQGSTRKVVGLMIHSEANNSCVKNWMLVDATSYVESKLAAVAQYGPIYTAVGYGFRNTPEYRSLDKIDVRPAVVSKGFPVKTDGSIGVFPYNVDLIGYYVYDIHNPNNPGASLNKNNETWTSLNAKLNQALRPGQKTAVVIKGFCDPLDPLEGYWGVTCPNHNTWKIGFAARNWKNYALQDSRNLFVIGFHWPNFPVGARTAYGTNALSVLWPYHSEIEMEKNCTVPTTYNLISAAPDGSR